MTYDAVIVGAGPAGLTAAKFLAKNNRNKRVLVLEKESSVGDKVCAGGITKKTVSLIPKELIEKAYNSIIVHSPLQTAKLKQKEPFIWMINRKKLVQWQLKEAEKAGADIFFNSNIKNVQDNYLVCNNKKIRFKYLIGADGSTSTTRKNIGMKNEKLCLGLQYIIKKEFNDIEIFFNYRKYGNGYLWIFPHKGYTSIGICTISGYKNILKVKKNLQHFIKTKGIDYKNAKFEAALLNADYKGFRFGNKFLAGDAAGLVSELTGEGIYQAIVSGEDIAKGILNPEYNFTQIKNILEIKRKHSKILKKLMIAPYLTGALQEIALLLLRNQRFSNKIINVASF